MKKCTTVVPKFNVATVRNQKTATVANKKKLQVLQNCALRTVLKCNKRTPSKYKHHRLNMLTLDERGNVHWEVEC